MKQRGFVKLPELHSPCDDQDSWARTVEVLEGCEDGSLSDVYKKLKRWGGCDLDGWSTALEQHHPSLDERKLVAYIKTAALKASENWPEGLHILRRNNPGEVSLERPQIITVLACMMLGLTPKGFGEILNHSAVFSAGLIAYFAEAQEGNLDKRGPVRFVRRMCPPGPPPVVEKLASICIETEHGIEDTLNAAHADFANKNVGGGFLSGTRAQEEIMFASQPECSVAMLILEELSDLETSSMHGAVKTAVYKGYGFKLKYEGRCHGPAGEILAFDALDPNNLTASFSPEGVQRELLKAYTAFSTPSSYSCVSTGNWGCGAFLGCRQLKSTIQWIAASWAAVSLVYHTFGDKAFTESMREFVVKIEKAAVTPEQLHAALMSLELKRNRVHEIILEHFGL
eukprot:TRINITY_DN750_c9_g1_i1.p1 TRINITY_DN750_c9_g1~~TRINITY_DN750_c9_g1_i1.p1  ORF type:complete len:398 (+),score=70.09 TRINITY_DN750_c9_g1_i1:60-1253(+)